MPIYEYGCTDCGHELEVLQKMNDLPLEQCPACGQNTLKKRVSAAAFHLKGSGWYETDFSGKKKKSEESEKTDTDSKEKKSDTSQQTSASDKKSTSTSDKSASSTSAAD